MPQHPATPATASSGRTAGRSMDDIRADFTRCSAARKTAADTMNLSLEAIYSRKIEVLLDERLALAPAAAADDAATS